MWKMLVGFVLVKVVQEKAQLLKLWELLERLFFSQYNCPRKVRQEDFSSSRSKTQKSKILPDFCIFVHENYSLPQKCETGSFQCVSFDLRPL